MCRTDPDPHARDYFAIEAEAYDIRVPLAQNAGVAAVPDPFPRPSPKIVHLCCHRCVSLGEGQFVHIQDRRMAWCSLTVQSTQWSCMSCGKTIDSTDVPISRAPAFCDLHGVMGLVVDHDDLTRPPQYYFACVEFDPDENQYRPIDHRWIRVDAPPPPVIVVDAVSDMDTEVDNDHHHESGIGALELDDVDSEPREQDVALELGDGDSELVEQDVANDLEQLAMIARRAEFLNEMIESDVRNLTRTDGL